MQAPPSLLHCNSMLLRRRLAGEHLPPPPKTAIAGPEYFGLTHPQVQAAIEDLDPEGLCADYWAGKQARALPWPWPCGGGLVLQGPHASCVDELLPALGPVRAFFVNMQQVSKVSRGHTAAFVVCKVLAACQMR